MKKEMFMSIKTAIVGALDWELYLGPVSAFLLAALQYWLGPMDSLVNLLLWILVVDYVTGWIKGAVNGELSSRLGAKGVLRKFGKLIIVGLAVQIGKVLGTSLIRIVVMGGYISNELLSIIENGEACGVIPTSLAKTLLQYQRRLSDLFKLREEDE